MNFKDKVVLVTGAGGGIGRKTAVAFAEHGAIVAVNNIPPSAAGEETLRQVEATGARGLYVEADVTKATEVAGMVEKIVQAYGRLDIVVNNAGIVLPGRVDNMSEAAFDLTMQVNVKGTFLVSQHAVRQMKAQGGGVVVNIASVAAQKGILDRSAYCASKGAVLALPRAMAADHIQDKIRVNCICPGTTYTASLEERIQALPDPEAARRDFLARQPMGRFGLDSEIAYAILFACCDEAAFMNGSIINIDGGALI